MTCQVDLFQAWGIILALTSVPIFFAGYVTGKLKKDSQDAEMKPHKQIRFRKTGRGVKR